MKITREELYRRVWESPVTHVAKELDISDVGLSKACRRNDIPLPPVGYWTKRKYGRSVPQPPLPTRNLGDIEIDARRFRTPKPERSQTSTPALVVTPDAATPPEQYARFARSTHKKLLGMKPDKYGLLVCGGPDHFDCSLSTSAMDVACGMLNAIERALPLLGATLLKGEKHLEVEHVGQRVSFRFIEQYVRTAYEVRDTLYKGYVGTDFSYEFIGKFTLEIQGYFHGRKRWTDGVRQRLSEKLGEFVQGLADAALSMKRIAEEREAQRLKWAEDARIRQEREQQQRLFEDFRQKLLAEADAMLESERMLAYLEKVKGQVGMALENLEQPARDWLETAESVAAQMCPLPRRVKRLLSGDGPDTYGSYFGRTLL